MGPKAYLKEKQSLDPGLPIYMCFQSLFVWQGLGAVQAGLIVLGLSGLIIASQVAGATGV